MPIGLASKDDGLICLYLKLKIEMVIVQRLRLGNFGPAPTD